MKPFLAATMFAHFQQETSGLYYLEEIAKSDYCATWSQWVKKAYPCTPGNLNIKISKIFHKSLSHLPCLGRLSCICLMTTIKIRVQTILDSPLQFFFLFANFKAQKDLVIGITD